MKNEELIKQELKDFIQKNRETLPYLSNFWNIDIIQRNVDIKYDIKYGHFNTVDDKHTPFFKPYSRTIDFSQLNEE